MCCASIRDMSLAKVWIAGGGARPQRPPPICAPGYSDYRNQINMCSSVCYVKRDKLTDDRRHISWLKYADTPVGYAADIMYLAQGFKSGHSREYAKKNLT